MTSPRMLLKNWIDVPSISGEEHAFLVVLEAFFRRSGWKVERHPVEARRWNLLITSPNASAFPEVLFCTHVDTVPPHFPCAWRDGRYYGRGAVDTKGGLVGMALAAAALRDNHALGGRVGLLLVVGEESDHAGAGAAVRSLWSCRHVILGEPTRCRLISHQKGLLKVRIRTRGTAAHSAFPHRGSSAVHSLLDILHEIRSLEWPIHPVLGETTLNVGLIEGGVAPNVFAPEAEATLVFRLTCQPREVRATLEAVCEGSEVEILTKTPPLELFVPEGDWETDTAAFNSDAMWMREIGTVTMAGPGSIERAHSKDEYITHDELLEGIEFYERLGATLLEHEPLFS